MSDLKDYISLVLSPKSIYSRMLGVIGLVYTVRFLLFSTLITEIKKEYTDVSCFGIYFELCFILFSLLIVILVLLITYRYPSFIIKKGIIFIIKADSEKNSEEMRTKIQRTLIQEYSELSQFNYKIKFVNYLKVDKRVITDAYLRKIVLKTKAVMIYSIQIKNGKVQGVSTASLNSKYIVRHKPIVGVVQFNVQKIITRNLNRAFSINMNNDLEEVKKFAVSCIISSLIGVGVVDIVNGQNLQAKKAFNVAYTVLDRENMKESKYYKDVKGLLIDSSMTVVNDFVMKYLSKSEWKKNDKLKNQLIEHQLILDDIFNKFGGGNYINEYLASTHFLIYRDPEFVIKLMKLNKQLKKLNATQKFDKAFLMCYQGESYKAYRLYKTLLKHNHESINMMFVYNYIEFIYCDEHDKYSLLIPLILINYFERDKNIVADLLNELKQKMKVNDNVTQKFIDEFEELIFKS